MLITTTAPAIIPIINIIIIIAIDIFSTATIILIMVQLIDDCYNNYCSAIILFDCDTIFLVV